MIALDYLPAAGAGAQLEPALDLTLPPELEAHEPPEAAGRSRDDVRLMVNDGVPSRPQHVHFRDLPSFLRPGDTLVINTSRTLPAAVAARRHGATDACADEPMRIHFSTRLPIGLWIVELRRDAGAGTVAYRDGRAGETWELDGGARVRLLDPFRGQDPLAVRLWLATFEHELEVGEYLATFGGPIRYAYASQPWPLEAYQTVYADEAGSAEMPSAGRAFTAAMINRLVSSGIDIVPITHHAGVSSQEAGEPPLVEYYRVSPASARRINNARAAGGRVIAVGTTVVRALESAATPDGTVHPASGWTDLAITPARGVTVVDGLLTGLHTPESSHLSLLQAIAPRSVLVTAYREAIDRRYRWHEFGDVHLLMR